MKKFNTNKNKALIVGIVAVFVIAGSLARNLSLQSNPAYVAQGVYELHGRVSHVADGDTINLYVNNQRQRIRLANIDAPESQGRGDRLGQPYADESTQALSAMVAGKTLTIDCFEQDHYGRHVCNIPYKDSTANQKLVEMGMAWAYTGSNERYLRDKNLKTLQAQAKRDNKGLWQDQQPIAPWVWRYQCWQQKQCD